MVSTKPRSAAVPAMHAPAHCRRRVRTMEKTPHEAHHWLSQTRAVCSRHARAHVMTGHTSFSLRPNRGLGPSCSSQHSGAKGTSPLATPPNMSSPASTATMTGPARVPGSLPLLFCKHHPSLEPRVCYDKAQQGSFVAED